MLAAYFDCRRAKRKKDSTLNFELDYEQKCYDLVQDINNRVYSTGRSVAFIVTRPKLREVFAAEFRDRVVHHWLIQKLGDLFESSFIEDTYNCRKGKGTQYGVRRLYEKIKQTSEGYTKDCWVGKFDMSGFFMSIYKPLLWNMLETFIMDNYREPDIEDVLYVCKIIVLSCPQYNCLIKMPLYMWNGLDKKKSLFTNDPDYGLPIGNLTSQIFANFYLREFDWIMTKLFDGLYGRYVDDFYIVSDNKSTILEMINSIKEYLSQFKIILHPNKINIQHYTKGLLFVGGYLKPNRMYTSNRTISNFIRLISGLNKYDTVLNTERVVSRINSYLGFLIHTSSYTIRRRLLNSLDDHWYNQMYIRGDYRVIASYDEYKMRYIIAKNIKNNISW